MAARTNAPVQSDTSLAPRACAAISASFSASDGSSSGSDQPGTTIVSARSSSSSPCGALDHEARLRPNPPPARRDEEELVPGVDDVATVEAEDLAGDGEVERQRTLIDDRSDDVHGRKLAKVVAKPAAARATIERRCGVSGFLVLAAAVLVLAGQAAGAGLPGARALKVCAAAGPYWPTMTLALQGNSAWVACKEQSRVIRVDTRSGKTSKSVRLRGPVIAVASGFGSIWALDSGSTLYRINRTSAKVTKRVQLPVAAAYNIWIGGGSVWVADDQGAKVVRVSPATNRVVARPRVGDGPADMAFNGDERVGHQPSRPRAQPYRPPHERSSRVALIPG